MFKSLVDWLKEEIAELRGSSGSDEPQPAADVDDIDDAIIALSGHNTFFEGEDSDTGEDELEELTEEKAHANVAKLQTMFAEPTPHEPEAEDELPQVLIGSLEERLSRR